MPTGYTAKVQEGKSTFNEFVWNCAHAFVTYDEPMDSYIKLKTQSDDYHQKSYDESKQKLYDAINLTDREWQSIKDHEDKENKINDLKYQKQNEVELKNYNNMLDKVKAWNEKQIHTPLKKFMISQLEESIDFDCDPNFVKRERPVLTLEEYKAKRIEHLEWSVNYHKRELEKQIENNKKRNEFVQELALVIPQPNRKKV